MTNVRRFVSNVRAIAYKEFALLRHDKTVAASVLVQPIIMLLVFGFAMSFRPYQAPWAVLDRSDTAASRRLISDIHSIDAFAPPMRVQGYAQGRALLRRSEATIFLVIPTDFRRDLETGGASVQLLLDGSDPLQAARLAGYVTQIAGSYALDRRPVVPVQEFRFNPTLRDRDFFLAVLAGFLLTNICLAAASLGLVAEKESGTYEQLLAQPTTALQVVLGKLVPSVALSYVALAISVLGAGLVYNYWPTGSFLTLALATLPFVLATLGIATFVSAISRTSAQAVFIAIFFIMPSFVLSGSMLPYQLMPHGVREIGALFPLRWYQILSRRIIERGAGLEEVLVPTLVLIALFLGILVGIRWRMKPRLG